MLHRSALAFVVGLSALPLVAHAQTAADSSADLAQWRERHGASWRVDVDEGTGYAQMLFGGARAATFAPADDAEWFIAARDALAESAAIHGIQASTLIEDRVLFLPLGTVGTTDKMTVRFRQVVGEVPVDSGTVNVLFDARGRLLSVQTHALPDAGNARTVPSLSAEGAADIARREFFAREGVPGSVVSPPELVVAQMEQGGRRVPLLAWKANVQWLPSDAYPIGFEYTIDALTGGIARIDHSVHNFDVGGTVRSMATPGVAPDTASNPETSQVMKYARVQSSAGTVFTDAGGNFNFPGATGPLNCTFTYVGTYNNVTNQSGAAYSSILSLTGTGNVVTMNPAPTEYVTAQANAFIGINDMRDWIRAVNPFDATADFVHTANCNINSACNAYYNGSSTNYFIAAGGCVNSSYSTVIAHEDGHWLNDLYSTGNGFDGMGEGNADVFAMYLYDTNIVAQDFFGPGAHIRDGLNTRQFCGDCCAACYGEVHSDGEVWMGAAWKIRRNLNATLGDAAGDALADAIFLAWMNAYNQTQIKTVIETQWLTLDDNDGNIGNGTPHYFDIDDGFVEQGFPGVPFDPITISAVTQVEDTSSEAGPYTVQATIASNLGGGSITSATLHYRSGWSGAYSSVALVPQGGGVFSGGIPGQTAPTKVFYYVSTTDNFGNTASHPLATTSDPLFFGIGNIQTLHSDSFEAYAPWVASTGSGNTGLWERGDPLGTFKSGAAAQPELDATPGSGTLCWFTDQGSSPSLPDEADVDGGPQTLTSPAFNVTFGNAEFRYSYWFYNDDGDDSLLVQVSNNGTSWTTARTHSTSASAWRTAKVDVSSFVATGPTVYVRFSVTDSPNNSTTEAAIDDLALTTVTPLGCAQPVVYCATKIDSNFCASQIGFSGYAKVSGTSVFDISLSAASNNRNGLLFYGYGTYVGPFQGGALCCQGPVRRTSVQQTGGTIGVPDCTGQMHFDFNAHIRSGIDSGLYAGRTVATQYYYRDPMDSFGVGLSNGLYFTICQ